MSHNFDTGFFGSSLPAWHGLGNVLEGQLTSAEAIVAAEIDWTVRTEPVYRLKEGVDEDSFSEEASHGQFVIREDTNEVLAVVGPEYVPVQNIECFEFMDALLDEGVRYETAISLKGGREIVLLAVMPEDLIIAGDIIKPYCMMYNSHDGSRGLMAKPVKERIVCSNTLAVALAEEGRAWHTKHVGKIKDRMKEAAKVLNFSLKHSALFKEHAEKLLMVKVTDDDYEKLIHEILLPAPEGVWDDEQQQFVVSKRSERFLEEKRTQMWAYTNKEDLQNFVYTGWGMLNAVADYCDHHKPSRVTANFQENRFMNVVSGHPFLKMTNDFLIEKGGL